MAPRSFIAALSGPAWLGLAFALAVGLLLGLDLWSSARRPGPLRPRQALAWTAAWVALSLGFGIALEVREGPGKALQFLTGYVIEYALSVDNLFVFIVVFASFKVGPVLQRRLLTWGVLGAFVMRALLIGGGVALIRRFEWLFYVFGAFLVFTSLKMLFGGGEKAEPAQGRLFKLVRRLLPVSESRDATTFFAREGDRWKVTSLFLALIAIESTDLLFALDSIPAVLGISRDPFVVYASNICAILGLRSLFFLLAGLLQRLRYLDLALAAVLAFIGVKMVLETWLGRQWPTSWSLGVVGALLFIAVVASSLRPLPKAPQLP